MASYANEHGCDWSGVPPSLIVADYVRCYETLSTILTAGYADTKTRALKARVPQRRTSQSETRFMFVRPDVVWIDKSEGRKVSVSSDQSEGREVSVSSDQSEGRKVSVSSDQSEGRKVSVSSDQSEGRKVSVSSDQSEGRKVSVPGTFDQSAGRKVATSVTSECSSGYGSEMSYQSEKMSDSSGSMSKSKEEDDPSYSLYLTEAPLVDNRIHYRTVGNQALADVLAQAHHLTDISLLSPKTNWYNEGWRYVKTERGVHILRKDTNRTNIYGIAGVGMIPKTPEYVYEIIRDPYYRFQYDKLLKTLDIVENVDPHTKVCQAHLEARSCLMKQSREMVLVVADRAEKDGFVTAVTSTEHPACPPRKNLPRQEMQVAGFLIAPYNVEGKLCTRLIYVLQVDMKGLPAFVVDFVMKHQPLAVAYIRQNILSKKDPTSMYLKTYHSSRTISN